MVGVSFGGKILKIGKMFLGPGFFCCFWWDRGGFCFNLALGKRGRCFWGCRLNGSCVLERFEDGCSKSCVFKNVRL